MNVAPPSISHKQFVAGVGYWLQCLAQMVDTQADKFDEAEFAEDKDFCDQVSLCLYSLAGAIQSGPRQLADLSDWCAEFSRRATDPTRN